MSKDTDMVSEVVIDEAAIAKLAKMRDKLFDKYWDLEVKARVARDEWKIVFETHRELYLSTTRFDEITGERKRRSDADTAKLDALEKEKDVVHKKQMKAYGVRDIADYDYSVAFKAWAKAAGLEAERSYLSGGR